MNNVLSVNVLFNDQDYSIHIPVNFTHSTFEELACDDYIDMIMEEIKADMLKKYRPNQSPQLDFANTEANECEGCDL